MCQSKESDRKASSEESDHLGVLNLGNKVMTKWILREIAAKEYKFS
jgi:hypothetical protein